ncbi:MAG TPA: peptide chain release factor N(5)-glutamine methyltransferase [Candidatus Krumholzibacteria bacterium]|nr:peptide chain release factor N(5)-glutamine methyltransferase [Candidatus Krumholzibacteria bacterium]HPD71952.1 peptide chain release factor N(5)-glutamine methyltransferase [Candidatus Krumholzibacteria bacterium]HRY41115.1 peptide chain release factor N(5)-glutamine methyltransferase [Candidatus Krumholzibacteria bacterium]
MKTVRELIALSGEYLAEKGIESARLNAERLLGDVLGLSRIELYLQADRPVAGAELDRYRDLVRRRGAGEPLQTIIGTTGFYSREFKVEEGVFIPRPETERLVETVIGLLTPPDRRLIAPRVAEVGCGSGVIAVSLAVEIPTVEAWATDPNPRAVELTRRNAHRHGVDARVHVLHGELLHPVPAHLRGKIDVLVSNPPYVRRDELAGLPAEVRHDPADALDGGDDGLDVHRALAAAAPRWLAPGGWLAVEIGADQGETVPRLFAAAGLAEVTMTRDYNDLPRVVVGRWPGGDA